jgi:chromosomal replication initiation ATPase DnaA
MGKIKMKVYFAHPISMYNTKQERELVKKIKEFCQQNAGGDFEFEIVNPANLNHEFEAWKKTKPKEDHDMRFFKQIISECDAAFFVGSTNGVRYELRKAEEFGIPTFDAEFIDQQ